MADPMFSDSDSESALHYGASNQNTAKPKRPYNGRDHSFVWQYCTKETAFGPAQCNLCNQTYSNLHGTTSNLRRHLKIKHGIDDPAEARRSCDPGDGAAKPGALKMGNKKRSFVWKYFTNYGHEARCLLCGAAIKTISTTTSCLRKHLYTKHKNEINEDTSEMVSHSQSQTQRWSPVDSGRAGQNINQKPKVFTAPAPRTLGGERKNSSPVWKYMTRDHKQNNANCMLCDHVFKDFKKAHQFYNIKKHLAQVHTINLHEESLKQESSSADDAVNDSEDNTDSSINSSPHLSSSLSGAVVTKTEHLESPSRPGINNKYYNSSAKISVKRKEEFDSPTAKFNARISLKRKEELDILTGRFLVSTLQHSSVVDNRDFRNLMTALNPHYQLPNATEISEGFMSQTVRTLQEDISLSLQHADRVALSGDVWTSYDSRQYVTISAHFVCQQGNLCTYVLNTIPSNDITSCMEDSKQVLCKWGIEGKVVSVVANPESIFAYAVKDHLGLAFLPCFAQTFNKAVIGSLSGSGEVLAVVRKVRDISKYFESCEDLTNMLREVQRNNKGAGATDNVNTEHAKEIQLKTDNPEHWLTTFAMLKNFLNYHEEVTTALCYLNMSHLCLVEEELGVARRMVVTLTSCSMAAEELSKSPSISMVIPMLKQLRQCLESTTPGTEVFPMTSDLLTRLSSVSFVLEKTFTSAAATVLDPRFKKLAFSDCNDVESVEGQLKERLEEMDRLGQGEKVKVTQEGGGAVDLWSSFDTRVDQMMETSSQTIELQRYTEIRLQRRDANPIAWWKSNQAAFPHLATLAGHFLVIPATAVPYAGLFSEESDFVKKRKFISKEDVDRLIFLHQNYLYC